MQCGKGGDRGIQRVTSMAKVITAAKLDPCGKVPLSLIVCSPSTDSTGGTKSQTPSYPDPYPNSLIFTGSVAWCSRVGLIGIHR